MFIRFANPFCIFCESGKFQDIELTKGALSLYNDACYIKIAREFWAYFCLSRVDMAVCAKKHIVGLSDFFIYL